MLLFPKFLSGTARHQGRRCAACSPPSRFKGFERVNALDDALFDDFCTSLEMFLQDSQRTGSAKFQKAKRTMMLAFRNMVLDPLFDLGTSAAVNEEQTGSISTFTFNNQIFSMIVDNLGLGVNLHGYCGETLKCCRRSPHPTWIVACVYIPQ